MIKNSDTSSKSRLEHLGSLIAAKEEARRKAERQRDGLISLLAEAPGEKTKKAFLDKIEELTGQIEVMEGEKESLKQDRKNLASNIIDLEDAFELIRTFQKEFSKLSAHEQHELLKNAVKRVIVKENGITAEYYGSPREDLLPVGSHDFLSDESKSSDKKAKKNLPDYCRTGVRSLYNLVETYRCE